MQPPLKILRGGGLSKKVAPGKGKRRFAVAAVAAATLAGTFVCAAPQTNAYGNPLSDAWNAITSLAEGGAENGGDLSQYTVQVVTPRGTTINLFDYWLHGRDDPDFHQYKDPDYNDANCGINKGHKLQFGYSIGTDSRNVTEPWNVSHWTGSATYDPYGDNGEPVQAQESKGHPRSNIVQNKLGADGYPVLDQQHTGSTESLDYLLNPAVESNGKEAFTNVGGLLQVDDEGYYYYSSHQNFAQFNEGTNNFTLYNDWAVYPGGTSPNGQFFPFNTGEQVFDVQDGKLVQKKEHSTQSSYYNHYFGLSMSTRFVQQDGGTTESGQTVTYNFAGDDDVWIFIDGVLVADLGGIHDEAAVDIDFSTGDVIIYKDGNENNNFDGHDTNGDVLCTAETEPDGSVVLLDGEGFPVTVDKLHAEGVRNVILRETKTPTGYRGMKDVELYIEHYEAGQTANGEETNLLLSEDPWTTGAYAQAKVLVTAADTIELDNGEKLGSKDLTNSVMFIVTEKNIDGEWCPVTGDALKGWTVSGTSPDDDEQAAIDAGKATGAVFTIGTSGAYQAEVNELPGRIQDYVFFNKLGSLRGSYYYTSAKSLDQATPENTHKIENADAFGRQFSARLYVSNIVNRLLVQKVDQNGNPVNGATMGLFDESQVTKLADGSYVLNEDAMPIAGRTGVTETLSKKEGDLIDLEGAVAFSDLEPGIYYAAEVEAPAGAGYVKNNVASKVTVTDAGVYANAGKAGRRPHGHTRRGAHRALHDPVRHGRQHRHDAAPHHGDTADGRPWNPR